MPQVSQRSQVVPHSPFRKFIPLADEAKARGTRVYHLNIGQPDILTPPAALARLRQNDFRILEYSPAGGNTSYRKALTGYYRRFEVDLQPEQILITTGGSEAILFFLLSCLDPGDDILVPEPFYANYNGFAHMAGVGVRAITSSIEDGFSLPSSEQFAEAISPRTRAILITNPNNPTGCCYSRAELEALAEVVKMHDLFLCVDEVYREFVYGDEPFYSTLRLVGLEDHVVVVDSVSKRYSACGARVGALISRNTGVLEAVERYGRLRLSPPGLGQLLAEYMLQDDAAYLEAVKYDYENRRNTVYRRLQAMPGVFSYLPGGAFYCFARVPVDSAEKFCRWLLTDFSYNGATVMLSHGEAFYATPGLGIDEVRVAYILNEQDLEAAMDCLEVALRQYPGRREPAEAEASVNGRMM